MSLWDNIDKMFDEVNTDKPSYNAWEVEPVSFREFNESQDYLNAFPLAERQYQDVENVIGKDPKLIFHPSRIIALGVFVWGKGSGKDLVIARVFAYIVFVLECLKSPQKFLWEVDKSVHMDLVNVARKGGQAKEIFFAYFSETIKNGEWFKERFIIRESNKIVSTPSRNTSKGTIDIGTDKIEFPKNIRAHAETSAFEGYEGYNIVVWVADELSAFKSKSEVENAEGIYNTLRTSGSSRATKHFKALGLIISYPRQAENDLTLMKYQESFENNSIYGSFGWPWHIKPAHLYSGKTFEFSHSRVGREIFGDENIIPTIQIPIELYDDFRDDPTDAMCKYLCVPPLVVDQWVEYPDLFLDLLRPADDIFITEDYLDYEFNHDTQQMERRIKKKFLGLRIDPRIARSVNKYVVWLDAAETLCDASIGIGHEEPIGDSGFKLVQDSSLTWVPDKENNIKISLMNVEEFLTQIIPANINAVSIGSDYWNSSGMSEKLRASYPNIRSVQSNLDLNDYNLMKRFVYTGQTEFHFSDVVNQIVRLRRGLTVPQPPKDVKGKAGGKDRADGWVGVVKLLKGPDARKSMGMISAPQTTNVSEMPRATNLFNRETSPFYSQSVMPFEHRQVESKEFRDMLHLPNSHSYKRWHDDDNKNNNSTKRRLPLSTNF